MCLQVSINYHDQMKNNELIKFYFEKYIKIDWLNKSKTNRQIYLHTQQQVARSVSRTQYKNLFETKICNN